MIRGEHLCTIRQYPGRPWDLVCKCGARWALGTTFYTINQKGQPITRKVRTLRDARAAHMIHYASDEAATYCEHKVKIVQAGRLLCHDCGQVDPAEEGMVLR
jgi:hypothetical protein